MRLFLILIALCPAALFGAGTRVPVQVTMSVPLVVAVEGPAQVVLAPGEMTRIRVGVLANVPWILSIQSPNASARVPTPLSGQPGGASANSRDLEISCSPDADGRQTITLVYTLMPG